MSHWISKVNEKSVKVIDKGFKQGGHMPTVNGFVVCAYSTMDLKFLKKFMGPYFHQWRSSSTLSNKPTTPHNSSIRSDGGLTLETSAGQLSESFTVEIQPLSTQTLDIPTVTPWWGNSSKKYLFTIQFHHLTNLHYLLSEFGAQVTSSHWWVVTFKVPGVSATRSSSPGAWVLWGKVVKVCTLSRAV